MSADPSGQPPTCYRHPDRETYIRCQRCDKPICPDCMRDAAVGFQCPQCVAQGAKQTRQGKAAYGGQRSANPALTSITLIGINVFVWLMIAGTGGSKSRLIELLALTPFGRCDLEALPGRFDQSLRSESACSTAVGGGDWAIGASTGAPWQLITNAFTHIELLHIALNMLAIWFLGPQLEAMVGRVRFLAVYFISAIAGSALVMLFSDQYTPTLGASGAVFGLLGALLVVSYKVKGNYQQLLLWLGINAVFTFTYPNVSWQGHLGGFLGGVLAAAVIVYAPRARRTPLQVAGLVVIAGLLVVAIGLRMAILA